MDELRNMQEQILQIARVSGVDARFILAIALQESAGCVRVCTTANGNFNPGLMQSHNGDGSCNRSLCSQIPASNVSTPCDRSEIGQMIKDGVLGTTSGPGLQQLLAEQGHRDDSQWFRAARMYNGGQIDPTQLLEEGCCTKSYASDIANRLKG